MDGWMASSLADARRTWTLKETRNLYLAPSFTTRPRRFISSMPAGVSAAAATITTTTINQSAASERPAEEGVAGCFANAVHAPSSDLPGWKVTGCTPASSNSTWNSVTYIIIMTHPPTTTPAPQPQPVPPERAPPRPSSPCFDKLTMSLRGSLASPRSPLAAAPSRLSLYLMMMMKRPPPLARQEPPPVPAPDGTAVS